MKTRSDFGDWLSPMVVKELRQGMRSRLFVWSFLIVQVAMILVALSGLAMAATHQSTMTASIFFWITIAVPLLLLMPLSGLNTVAQERRGNTLELVFLTRLTARRILCGKWLALLAQTALLVCAILPYALLRYVLGGVNSGSELLAIAGLLLASALLSGIAVGLSPQLSRLGRGLLAVVIFLSLQFIYPLLSYLAFRGGGPVLGRPAFDFWSWAALIVFALILLLLMWEFGASKIAPASENHASGRRLLGLCAIAFAVALGRTPPARLFLTRLALMLAVPICIGALCEKPTVIARIYRPFVRRGFLGKFAGRFVYPGWPSGVFYCLAVFLFSGIASYGLARPPLDPIWYWWTAISFAGTLLLPAALLHLRENWSWPIVPYLGIQILCALLALVASMLASYHAMDLRPFVAMIPATGLILIQTGEFTGGQIAPLFLGASAVTFASLCLLFLRMRKQWRDIRALEKIASLPPPSSASTDAPVSVATG